MKRECGILEELIWEHARTGKELSEKARRHIESCPECAQVLADAKVLSRLLADAGEVVHAPDCRDAVLSRIYGEGRRRIVPAWAYACAIVLIGAVVALGIRGYQSELPVTEPQVVKRVVTARTRPPVVIGKRIAKSQKVAKISPHDSTELAKGVKSGFVHRRFSTRFRAVNRTNRVPLAQQINSDYQLPDSSSNSPRSVAAVYVSWPQPGESDEVSYHYIERDAYTGETTTCSVRRSGDSIEIYIESTTPGGEEPPVKGDIQNEDTINA